MSLELFVNENPVLSANWGLDDALKEIRQLRRRVEQLKRYREIVRTLIDKRASIEEFQAAVKAVTG
jgi:hypothetical protein